MHFKRKPQYNLFGGKYHCYYWPVPHPLQMPEQIPFSLTPIETLSSESYLMTIKISITLINTNSRTRTIRNKSSLGTVNKVLQQASRGTPVHPWVLGSWSSIKTDLCNRSDVGRGFGLFYTAITQTKYKIKIWLGQQKGPANEKLLWVF